jgi:hypothetical protein
VCTFRRSLICGYENIAFQAESALYYFVMRLPCLRHKTGDFLTDKSPIEIKKHGKREISIFQIGIVSVKNTIIKICSFNEIVTVNFLSCALLEKTELQL